MPEVEGFTADDYSNRGNTYHVLGRHADALADYGTALRLDPNCGLAAYYAGEIERQLGHPEEAEGHLRRAIKLMSPDRRPIEALKALSGERRR